MPKKRHISQLDEPPIPASKDDQKPPQEEDIIDDEEEEEEEEEGSTSSQAASSSEQVEEEEEEEEDDDEEEDNQQTPSQPASKIPPPPSSNSHPKSSSSSEETDAESESDPEPNPKLKPLPSKPIKSKAQVQAQSSPPPTKSGTKRPTSNDAKQSNKKKKTTAPTTADEDDKEPEDDAKKTGDDSKKYFQRLFSEDDEVVILQALVDFTAKTGNDPYKYLAVFYEFVKKLIHVEVTMEQLRYKIRRLKQKFENKLKSGKPPTSAKPIEKKAFELGLKIWGDKPKEKSLKKERATKKPTTTKKLVMEPDSPLVVLNESRKAESSGKIDESGANLILNEMVRFDRNVGFPGLNVDVINKGVVLLDESQREEFEGRWKKLHIAELELFTRRAELVEEQTCLILDALRASLSH